jgi:hypothetical protein
VNLLRSVLTFRPITFSQFMGHIPSPGRSAIIFFSVIVEPDFKSLERCILFRAIYIFFFSLQEASLTPFPEIALYMFLIDLTISLSSCGSNEAL